jgi:hypothetical protein
LNSRLNLRLCITHLRLHETPYLGVHQTGSSSRRQKSAALLATTRYVPSSSTIT